MDLVDLVGSLQRAVAPPGEFDTFYPDSGTTDLTATLTDALSEAQLDGFLSTVALDVDAASTDVDLTPAQQALVVLYARARVVTARLANLKNLTRYKAGNVEAETQQSASVLVEILRDTRERKKQLLDDARTGAAGTSFSMVDLYLARSLDTNRGVDLQYMQYNVPDLG